jgi:hypothetical protein
LGEREEIGEGGEGRASFIMEKNEPIRYPDILSIPDMLFKTHFPVINL